MAVAVVLWISRAIIRSLIGLVLLRSAGKRFAGILKTLPTHHLLAIEMRIRRVSYRKRGKYRGRISQPGIEVIIMDAMKPRVVLHRWISVVCTEYPYCDMPDLSVIKDILRNAPTPTQINI